MGTTKNSIMKMNFEEEYSTIMQVSGFSILRRITDQFITVAFIGFIRDILTRFGDLPLPKPRTASFLQAKGFKNCQEKTIIKNVSFFQPKKRVLTGE